MHKVSDCFRQPSEIFAFDERQDLFCAVAERVPAVAVSDNCVVLCDRRLFFYDCVAAGVDALADFGVVELDLCGGGRERLGEEGAVGAGGCGVCLRLFLRWQLG